MPNGFGLPAELTLPILAASGSGPIWQHLANENQSNTGYYNNGQQPTLFDRLRNRWGTDLGTGTSGTTQPTITDTTHQTDAPAPSSNAVLQWRFGDANMDKYLWTTPYSQIRIDTPPNVQVKNWADQNGYFFWFQRTDNGAAYDGIKHYYPPSAKSICINGQYYDLEAQRLKVNENVAAAANGGQPYFANLNQNMSRNPMSVVQYAAGMSHLSGGALATMEGALEQSVKNSQNPYFKIYLSDVYVAQAMQPIMQQVLQTGHVDLANPQTLQRIDMAINLLNSAVADSRGGLARINQNVPGNVALPLDPYEIYMNNGYNSYYGFWGGSYDQAMFRAASLTTLRNLITNGALASQLSQIDLLPPALPPRTGLR
ncbi:MAG: hypothetical protein ACRD3W_27360 [Terriglobales bacterium]